MLGENRKWAYFSDFHLVLSINTLDKVMRPWVNVLVFVLTWDTGEKYSWLGDFFFQFGENFGARSLFS